MAAIDVLVAEIGSTTTVVSAFTGIRRGLPELIGQGQAATTVLDGDVTLGLNHAIDSLQEKLGAPAEWQEMVASSSAAGGLRMTVHGLVYDMTVKAAKEAALGAGANIHLVTAGELSESDLDGIRQINPNIILLAGGVDYGEKLTAIANARRLATGLAPSTPIIYAGNVAAKQQVCEIFAGSGFSIKAVDNVYPRIDQLNIEPTRRVIHEVFEKHITEAPGMHKIRKLVNGRIIPTPGAVMQAVRLLREEIGDLVVLDVGGATTDVHSVAEADPEIAAMLITPEPLAKRTVEGDLGVYVNSANVLELADIEQLCERFGCTSTQLASLRTPLPVTAAEKEFAGILTEIAVNTAIKRHTGTIEYIYGPTGRMAVARGKDLTGVKWIIGTGGALTRLPAGLAFLSKINVSQGNSCLLPRDGQALIDRHYVMAAAGLLAERYPEAALNLMRQSLGI
ncbi:GlmL-related ornithine degradation protein [Sporomusa sp.]|uniref:GlmL-related ornithine degradation protein n=1 Tax=Sporomusa sp. TaxID=2078658 RepID=UPI002BA523DD|nr:GlmL-related ornithine degradation protein [Sporomusa sp.]HWR42733.1 GlmL-related ornithine degradation protein [Sporomusa sp.]